MRVHVPTLHPDSTLRDVLNKLTLYQTTAIPVVDQDRRLVGMVTRGETLLRAVRGSAASLCERVGDNASLAVSEWMSKETTAVRMEDDAEEAAARMMALGLDALPVVEGERLVAVLFLEDILEAFALP